MESPQPPIAPPAALIALDAHGNAHAAADAERGKALLGVALGHLVQQGDQNAGARGADRVAEGDGAAVHVHLRRVPAPRSEEHTSELQSLMRISYAVFCLTKKKQQ